MYSGHNSNILPEFNQGSMRRPSVLFLNRVYPPTQCATGRVLRDLARSFAREGWQVTVITSGSNALKERDGGIRVIRVKAGEKPSNIFSYALIWIKMLIAALRLPPTHLVVTMSDPPLLILAGQIIKHFKKNRHMNWCHDLYPDLFPALGVRISGFILKPFDALTRRAMNKCDKLIVIGRCMAKHLSASGVNPRHITVIPNWPDFELMRPANKNGFNGVSSASGINESSSSTKVHYEANGAKSYEEQVKSAPKFRVLYAGNLGRAHPIDTILDAAEILNDNNPEIEFLFVGNGPRFDMLAQERSKRRLDNIRLLPYQPANRLREIMESGDVHLISMKDEAAGMLVPSKLYAALAVQRPCVYVGPAQSETAKVITDFKAGVVVEQGYAQELADRIKEYRMSGESWFSAHNGAASAGQVFVPKDAIDAWIERAWSVVQPDINP